MKIISIVSHDTVNSITGFTMSIYFSGCDHHCDGCFSKNTWNYNNGKDFDLEEIKKIIKDNIHKNVSLIGGDPLYYKNRKEVIELIKYIKKINKIVYLWTGYKFEEVCKILKEEKLSIEDIDYLIDGKFELEKRNLKLKLRGSENQNIYKNGKLLIESGE